MSAVIGAGVQFDDVDGSITRRFEKLVDLHASRTILRTPSQEYTYEQVEMAANRVANELLVCRGKVPEPVPLIVSDPALMLISLLGVLKAGKFYVPVNPNFPAPRIRSMLADIDPVIALCDEAGKESAVKANACRSLLQLENVLSGDREATRPTTLAGPDNLAYVLYTSGSMGQPKGVAQTHRSVLHNIFRHQALNVCPDDRVTLISADGFLGSVSNPYVAFLNGASLFWYSFRQEGVHEVVDWLDDNGITFYYSFPSFFRQFVAACSKTPQTCTLRLLYLGGETVFASDVASAHKLFPCATVAVGLNSTETGLTTLDLMAPGTDIPKQIVPVGNPVSGVEIKILDSAGRDVQRGSVGEIAVSSKYIAPSYWRAGHPIEDGAVHGAAEAFSVFRTGDRGYISDSGALVHMGRIDSMVKVRGYRVELAEVEACLSAIPGVGEAVVVPHSPTPEEVELVAYAVVRDPKMDGTLLRRLLAEVLPEAMVPSIFVLVDALPRTSNGKLNRRALPVPPAVRSAPSGQYVAPRNDVEAQIANIWSRVLSVPQIGVKDNFFDVGGHSLTAVRLISVLRKELGVALPLRTIFETPTVAALADEVARLLRGKQPPEIPAYAEKVDHEAAC